MKKFAIAVIVSVFITSPVVAAEAYYAGVNVGSAKVDFPGSDSTISIALLGGYIINENFSVEAAYTSFGSKNYANGTVKSQGVNLSGVYFYPFSELFSVFAKVGVASTTFDATVHTGASAGVYSTRTSKLTYGLGAQFYLTQQMDIRLGYDSYKVSDSGDLLNQGTTSVGGIYKF